MIEDFLNPAMSVSDINQISSLGLAHIGDSVYEILVRTWLCTEGDKGALDLHRDTIKMVNAKSQAKAYEKIKDRLSQEEMSVYTRGRNAKVNSVPNNTSIAEYHCATGLEALFGFLWLKGEKNRIDELFGLILDNG